MQRDASVDALLELDEEAQAESLPYKPFELEVELDITSSGESGFELVRTAVEEGNPYAVIYLDMRMPGRWDGIATAREIRSLDQNVRIIVITAYTENLESLHEIIGNAFVYLKKPFMSEELLQMTRFLAEDWQLARQLQHTVNDVVEAETAKNQFLSMISHEMRTPITTILGNGELLATCLETEEARSLLRAMEGAARQLHEHFNDLMEASQLHANMVEFDTHPFDLSRQLEQLQAHYRQQAEAAGLAFFTDFDAPASHYCVGNEQCLRRVLDKLLENALKFTEQGHVRLVVKGHAACSLSFVVEDSGIGIPPEQLKSLAAPFHQLDKSLTRRHGGNGLGLYIAKGLVNLNSSVGQAGVCVQACAGQGTTTRNSQLLQGVVT